MKLAIVFVSSLSMIIVVLTIIFEGRIKRESFQRTSFFSEIKKLSFFGWSLIVLSIVLGLTNVGVSYYSVKSSEAQIRQDSLQNEAVLRQAMAIINKLKVQRTADSLEIAGLQAMISLNGLKSDSIRIQLIENDVNAIKQDRELERKRRIALFKHLRAEASNNLKKVIRNFNDDRLKGFLKTDVGFVSERLSSTYMRQYGAISENDAIIGSFYNIAKDIEKVNYFCDLVAMTRGKDRNPTIRAVMRNIHGIKEALITIYLSTQFREYESFEKKDWLSLSSTSNSPRELDSLLLKSIDGDHSWITKNQ